MLFVVTAIMSEGRKAFPREHALEMEMEDQKNMSGTAKDAHEMDRLGRQQQLNVRPVRATVSYKYH